MNRKRYRLLVLTGPSWSTSIASIAMLGVNWHCEIRPIRINVVELFLLKAATDLFFFLQSPARAAAVGST